MDYAGLARLMIRLAGIMGLSSALGHMPAAMQQIYNRSGEGATVIVIGALGSVLVPATIGLLLFFFPGRIANAAFDEPPAPSDRRPDTSKIEGAALFVLGCYLLCYAIFDAVYLVAKVHLYYVYVQRVGFPGAEPPIMPQDFGVLLETIVKFIVALLLIFFSRGITALKDRILGLRGFPPS
jgi:hypothetical protein